MSLSNGSPYQYNNHIYICVLIKLESRERALFGKYAVEVVLEPTEHAEILNPSVRVGGVDACRSPQYNAYCILSIYIYIAI